jgi:hypothetical protein
LTARGRGSPPQDTSTAPTADPAKIDSTAARRHPSRGLWPPASVESAATPVSATVRTEAMRSGTANYRTVAFRSPIATAVDGPRIPDNLFDVLGVKTTTRQELCQRRTWHRGGNRLYPRIGHTTPCHTWHEYCSRKYPMNNEWLVRRFHTTIVKWRRVMGLVSAEWVENLLSRDIVGCTTADSYCSA